MGIRNHPDRPAGHFRAESPHGKDCVKERERHRRSRSAINPVSRNVEQCYEIAAAFLAIIAAAVSVMAAGRVRVDFLTGDSGKKRLHVNVTVISAEMDVEPGNAHKIPAETGYRQQQFTGHFHFL